MHDNEISVSLAIVTLGACGILAILKWPPAHDTTLVSVRNLAVVVALLYLLLAFIGWALRALAHVAVLSVTTLLKLLASGGLDRLFVADEHRTASPPPLALRALASGGLALLVSEEDKPQKDTT